jgi:membrane-bound serine protease (ClpP class)
MAHGPSVSTTDDCRQEEPLRRENHRAKAAIARALCGARPTGYRDEPFLKSVGVIGKAGLRRSRATVVALLAIALALAALGRAFASTPTAVHIRVEGVINPIKARYIVQALDRARRDNATFVIMSLDTPGGLVSSMEEMVSALTNSPIPIIGYVEPATAQATSAGAFLLLATDVAAMAPGTRVGAAHPVGSDKNLEGAMEEKATNSLVSLAKSLAARHGRSESYAEAIVRKSASYTADEAKRENAIELIAPSLDALLETLDGYSIAGPEKKGVLATKGVALTDVTMSWTNRLLDALSNPTLASILLTLGVLGILYELSSPGVGLAGIVGTICLILGLVALSSLPLKLGGFVLLLAGFIAIGVELKSPSHGALALGGLVAVALGALVLIDETGYFGAVQKLDVRIFLPFTATVTGAFVLFAAIAAKALRAPPVSGLEAMRGITAVARTRISTNGGMVFASGSRWQAISDSPIEEGQEVIVEETLSHPTRLRVRPKEKGAS